MKKIRFFSLVIVFLFTIAILITPYGEFGAYNTFSGWLWCKREIDCFHEIGHKLDHEGGWISHSREFTMAVQTYIIVEFGKEHADPLAWMIVKIPGVFEYDGLFVDHQAEIYARLFAHSRGVSENMPELLRPYYDWERAAELIEKVLR